MTTSAVRGEQLSAAAETTRRLSPPSQEEVAAQQAAEAAHLEKLRASSRCYFLPVAVEDAARECQKLNLERFQIKLVPIPAAGGCVVAVVPLGPKPRRRSPLTRSFHALRQRQAVDRAISQLGRNLVPQT